MSEPYNWNNYSEEEKKAGYNFLYERICKGAVVPCFVDYYFNGESEPVRDVCACSRNGEYSIHIGTRHITYDFIHEFNKRAGKTEKEIFIKACEDLNLAY